MSAPVMLEIGRIVKPHGLRGEVVVELVTNRAERVAPGSVLEAASGSLVVRAARPFEATGKGRWLVTFDGVADRTASEALTGVVLRATPLDDPDALWAHELIGAQVVDAAGDEIGTVTAIEANPASDLLVLNGGALIPLRFVTGHSPDQVTVEIPPGLLDL